MLTPINIDDYLAKYAENNKGDNIDEMRKALEKSIADKKGGATCQSCGKPIWAVGSAVTGYNVCYICLNGDDSGSDYEIDEVC